MTKGRTELARKNLSRKEITKQPVMAVTTMLLIFTGLDLVTAATAAIACINNTGPGLGEVGPASNYQGLSDVQTWVCTFAMLLGRLEMLSVLVLFTPQFWRR